MFPELFLRHLHKSGKNGQNDQISYFYPGFWFKIGHFEGWYLKNSSGNMSSNFYYDLYLLKIIEKWVYYRWRSFFPWDRFLLNLLCWVCPQIDGVQPHRPWGPMQGSPQRGPGPNFGPLWFYTTSSNLLNKLNLSFLFFLFSPSMVFKKNWVVFV